MTRPHQPHKRRGLALRLVLLILTSTTVIFVAAFGYNYYHARRLILTDVRQSAMHLARSVVLQIETRLDAVEALPRMAARHMEGLPDARTIGADTAGKALAEERLHALLQDMLAGSPDLFGSAAAFEPRAFDVDRHYYAPYVYRTPDGGQAFTQLGSPAYNYFLQDWYQIPKEMQRPVWSEPYFDEAGGGVLMTTCAHPFYGLSHGRRELRGVVTADVALAALVAQINAISIYKTGYAFLISRNGAFLAHPDKTRIMRESIFSLAEAYDCPEFRQIGRQMIRGASGAAAVTSLRTGRRSLLVYAPVETAGWSVGVVIAEDELFADLKSLNHTVLAIGAAGFALLLLVVVWISRSITRPIHRLVGATEQIARGNLEVALPEVRTRDEVQVLTRSVDAMRQALKDYIEDIARTTRAKERIESELKIARAIQMNFLPGKFPPFPDQPAFDLHAAVTPAREVGGDLYDFFMLDERHLFFSVGDVSDKGVPAALFMAVTKTLIKGIAEHGLTPADVLARVNVELCGNNETAMFVTVACGILDVVTGEVQYANAGHNPPVLLRAGQAPELLTMPPGLVLGAMDEAVYANRDIRLNPGDRLLLYTDGVTEAMDAGQRLFSEERLLKEAARLTESTPREMVAHIMAAVAEHAAGAVQSDDITVLALLYKGNKNRR